MVALVQSKVATGASPAGLAFNATPTAGSLLIAAYLDRNGVDHSSNLASGYTDGGNGRQTAFGSNQIWYKKAVGTESGEQFTDVSFKQVAWIAEFSGVDTNSAPQHTYFQHLGSGSRTDAFVPFTVSGDSLLLSFSSSDRLPVGNTAHAGSTQLFQQSVNNIETPVGCGCYRIVVGAGTYDVGSDLAAGADNLICFGLAWNALTAVTRSLGGHIIG